MIKIQLLGGVVADFAEWLNPGKWAPTFYLWHPVDEFWTLADID
jgi:hypothetical protein